MKRFVLGLTSKSMVTTEDKITAYETWSPLLHASATLDRWRKCILEHWMQHDSSYLRLLVAQSLL